MRRIAKLDYEAACEAFPSSSMTSHSTRHRSCLKKIIDYIVQNGYIETPTVLMKPPFDRPQSFIKLFDSSKQKQIIETVKKIKDNAVKIVG